jgi:hypothetical protein
MRILVRSAIGALCMLAGSFSLGVSFAPAAVTHEFLSGLSAKLNGAEPTPLTGPFGFEENGVQSMTVDAGELYVADDFRNFEGAKNRIDKFNASTGSFISQFPQLSTPGSLHQGVTVGHSTGEAQVYLGGDERVGEDNPVGVVAVLDTAGGLKAVWTGADTPSKGFGGFEYFVGATSIAVDRNPSNLNDWAAGDVYVVDSENKVVDVFKPLAGGGEEYVTQLIGPEQPATPFHPGQVTVNASNGDVLVTDSKEAEVNVDIFKPAAITGQYEFVGKLGGAPPGGKFGDITAMTVDTGTGAGGGDIYVAEPKVIDQFNAEGVYVGQLTGTPQGTSSETSGPFINVSSVAVDPASHDVYAADFRNEIGGPTLIDAFGPDVVIPDVTTGAVTGEKGTGEGKIEATLNGTVNPDKEGEVSCTFMWGPAGEFGQLAPCEPEKLAEGTNPVAVHAKLPALAPDRTYSYRLQASNKNGTNPGEAWQDKEFTTPGPGLHGASVSAVRAESGTFDAKIDPHGAPASSYFQYGTTSAYGAYAPALSEEAPHGATLGAGEGDLEASEHVTGLAPATLYHYRVVVLSELAPGQFEYFYGPDQTFTTQTVGLPFQLPDGRRWEMVSPPQKEGALLFSIGSPTTLQAAASGTAFVDDASTPTEAEPAGSDSDLTVFFGRTPSGWSSKVITPQHTDHTGLGVEYLDFSEADLSQGAFQPEPNTALLSPAASEKTPYLRTNYTGDPSALCETECFQPLVTPANVPPGTTFDETAEGPRFGGASPDMRHVVLGSSVALTSTPLEEMGGMYEWSEGRLALVNLLPKGESNIHGGQVAERVSLGSGLHTNARDVARHVISTDGSRIVWESNEKHLYLRDMVKGETVRLDVFQGVEKGPESASPLYQAASSDGSRIFFIDAERLTPDATAKSGRPDLYEYDLNAPPGSRLTDLSADPVAPASVYSVLGTSDDGSYVYFSAGGVLASGAVRGECGNFNTAPPGDTQLCNLYLRHNGATTFIAGLSPEDFPTWSQQLTTLPARVSPDGQWLAFMSNRNLAEYDTTDAITKHPDQEVYLYNGTTGKLACASCNPTGARPVGIEYTGNEILGLSYGVASGTSIASSVPVWSDEFYQSRYLANSGRLFFNSNDALAPQDVNGTQDVYEYEPAGVGSCTASDVTFSRRSEGCVGLISSGDSKEESAFLDASESGGDVFLLTAAKLSPKDVDNAPDIYDARECSAALPCFPVAPVETPPCETADSCKAAPSPQPTIFGAPASATFSGAGNVAGAPAAPAAKQKSLTRAQRLARALKACHKYKKKKRRSACQRQARLRYPTGKSRKANATKRGRR